MEFYSKYIRESRQLQPEYRSDFDELNKLKNNVVYKWDVKEQRNYKFLKKFFALLNLTHQNLSEPYSDYWRSFEDFREILLMKAGFYHTIKTEKGIIYRADSISFSSMDEIKFQEVYNRVCDECCKLLDVNKPTIEAEILNFV